MALTLGTFPVSVTATGVQNYSKINPLSTDAIFSISGTYAGVTLQFLGSMDGTNAFPLAAIDLSTRTLIAGSATITPGTNAIAAWQVPCEGVPIVQVNVTGYSSGTAVITAFDRSFLGKSPLGTATATRNEVLGVSTAAAGTTVADAGALPAGTGTVYPTTAADGTKGVVINAADQVTGRVLFIGNGVSNQILKVYGPTGAVINGAAANAAFSSASGKGVIIACLSGAGNTWLAW